MFGFIADAITSVVSILLPVFGTYKAIRTRDTATLTLWLIYWITLALVLLAESHFYFLLRWLPLYSWVRLAMYIYLVAPGQKYGSFFIYQTYIHPFLYRHEAHIDRLINQSNTRAFAIGWDLLSKTVHFIQERALGYYAVVSGADHSFRLQDREPIDHKLFDRGLHRPSSQQGRRVEELPSDEDSSFFSGLQNSNRTRLASGYDDRFARGVRKVSGHAGRDAYDMDVVHGSNDVRKLANKDRQTMLVQSALDRINQARAMGNGDPRLSHEEIEALERRLSQQPEQQSALATPPSTPAKHKTKDYSRSNSSSSLSSKPKKTRTATPTSSSQGRSNKTSKSQRKSSPEKAVSELGVPFNYGPAPSGIMVPGPHGVPVYAPLVYGNPHLDANHGRSRSPSVTSTGLSEAILHMDRGDARSFSPRNSARPQSASSLRSLPEDGDWYPARPRHPSISNESPYSVHQYLDEYDPTSVSLQNGRRSISGPAEISYSTVRRTPPSSPSKKGGRLGAQNSNSNIQPLRPRSSLLRREVGLEESSIDSTSNDSEQQTSQEDYGREGSEDDTGYEVEVKTRGDRGYYVQTTAMTAPTSSSPKRTSRKPKGKRK